MDFPNNYCSACQHPTAHQLHQQNYVRRNVYRCGGCGHRTVNCVVPKCKHMALTGALWDDNLCAEHNGTVPSLRAAKMQLAHIGEYDQVLKREGIDFSNVGKWSVQAASVAAFAVPGVGIAIGAAARAALMGGALISAMAKQTHFHIRRERDSKDSQHAVIFINGLMSQHDHNVDDWTQHLRVHFTQHSWFHVDWEAQQLKALGISFAKSLARPLTPAGLAEMALNNPWHAAVRNAEIAGKLLADAMARTPGCRYTLAGHSLGARVIRFALVELARRGIKCVDDVYLLGGAVGGTSKDSPAWTQALKALKGKIYNCHTSKDRVLQLAYGGASLMTCNAAGYGGIELRHRRIHNFECNRLVPGHMKWKAYFGEILRQLGTTVAWTPPPVKKRTRTVKKPAR